MFAGGKKIACGARKARLRRGEKHISGPLPGEAPCRGLKVSGGKRELVPGHGIEPVTANALTWDGIFQAI